MAYRKKGELRSDPVNKCILLQKGFHVVFLWPSFLLKVGAKPFPIAFSSSMIAGVIKERNPYLFIYKIRDPRSVSTEMKESHMHLFMNYSS